MKKLFSLVAIFTTLVMHSSFAQTSSNTQPGQLLSIYYEIKDALVAGNSTTASAKAQDFVVAMGTVDLKLVNEPGREALLKDASAISANKDLKEQRIRFAPFSENMIALAKTVKLSAEPVYQQYCPMKKASWLSKEQGIKNPYYGSAMLTCGSVKATL